MELFISDVLLRDSVTAAAAVVIAVIFAFGINGGLQVIKN